MQGKKWMERICRRYSEILGEQLTGIYLHGSAAFGCACDASDLDFIVVVSGVPSQQQKREMIALLLCLSREPDAPMQILDQPLYLTLNLCRVLAACRQGLVLSKCEGVRWAMQEDSLAEFLPMLKQAQLCYKAQRNLFGRAKR